ncbi:MAG: NlpC/P60 family protein, partial [Streptosporangiaceae bacterium]
MLAGATASEPGAADASGRPPVSTSAELNAARVQLAAVDARLAGLRNQAEAIIGRYDKTMVNLHQAAVAYQAAQQRLGRASQAESASRRQVGALAAQDYEAGGGTGGVVAMLGNAGGPQAFMTGAADEQQLARQRDDVLSQNQASTVVANVFRTQAHRELADERAAARQAAGLKTAIQAAVRRQQAEAVGVQASASRLAAELGAAQAHASALQQARRQAHGSRQQAGPAGASAPVTPAGGGQDTYGSWPSSYSLSQGASAEQGNLAANWAISQIGKPYQWGGAGPGSYDCSGLTMDAWARAGVTLLHWTGYQWPSGPHIPIDQLRRGDLLFYATNTSDPATIHHVGIYIGNGEMVDAPYT